MAGHALPLAHIHYPSISEAPNVIVRLALIRTSGVIHTRYNGRVAEEVHLHVLDVGLRRLEPGISNVDQEFRLVAHLPVPLCIDKSAGDERVQCRRIAVHLSFIPQALQDQDLALARIGLLGF